jgi:hypothetical protein
LKSEAALYDTAIREIGGISSMKLANPDESKAAQVILKNQTPNLKFIRSKLISLGLSDSSFGSAVKAKTGNDRKSAQEFAAELAKDRTAILKLNGAQSLKDKMLRTVESDRATLRKIADQLKQAAADIREKAKGHHAVRTTPGVETKPAIEETDAGISPSPDLAAVGVVTFLVVVVAVAVFPPLGLAFIDLAANAAALTFGESIAVFAAELIVGLKNSAGNEKQRDEVQACLDRAYATCDKCLAEAATLIVPGTELVTVPLYLAAADLCYGQQLLDLAFC